MCDASNSIKSSFSVHSEAIQIYMMDLIFFLLAKLGLTVVHAGIFYCAMLYLYPSCACSLDSFLHWRQEAVNLKTCFFEPPMLWWAWTDDRIGLLVFELMAQHDMCKITVDADNTLEKWVKWAATMPFSTLNGQPHHKVVILIMSLYSPNLLEWASCWQQQM